MLNLGIVRPGSTLRIPFSSFDKDDGSSITMTNFAVGDILVYKDGSTTERASTSGFTATTDFDAKTGKHLAIIDLADNTTAGFFAAGSEYVVALDAVTVDAVTTGGWLARFTIGQAGEWFSTTIATLSSQTSFTLTSGPAEDDALNGMYAIIHDVASAVQCSRVLILDYTGSTKTVTLAAGATFTAAATDNISVMGMAPLQPATLGRTVVIDSAGLADANTVKVGPTGSGTAQTARDVGASVLLSAGTGTGQLDFTSGVVKANLAQILGTALTETAGQIAAGFKQFFNVASPTSTMNTITAVTTTATATAVTTLNGIANNVITAASIAASALNGKGDWNIGKTGYSLSAAGVQAIWDALTSALTTASSVGKLLVDNVNATISSRASQTSVDTIDDFVDTEVAAIKAKTDQLTFTTANRVDCQVFGMQADTITNSAVASSAVTEIQSGLSTLDGPGVRSAVGLATANLDTQLGAIAGYIDTEVGALQTTATAIKAKTDNLPSDPADQSAVEAAITTAVGGLNNLSAAQVNAEVVDALNTDVYAEPGQGAPGATVSLATKIGFLYKAWRNRTTQTASEYALYADDATTKDQEAAVSDDGTTFERGEVTTGA